MRISDFKDIEISKYNSNYTSILEDNIKWQHTVIFTKKETKEGIKNSGNREDLFLPHSLA